MTWCEDFSCRDFSRAPRSSCVMWLETPSFSYNMDKHFTVLSSQQVGNMVHNTEDCQQSAALRWIPMTRPSTNTATLQRGQIQGIKNCPRRSQVDIYDLSLFTVLKLSQHQEPKVWRTPMIKEMWFNSSWSEERNSVKTSPDEYKSSETTVFTVWV